MAAAAAESWDEEESCSDPGSDDDLTIDEIMEREIKNAAEDSPPTFLRKSGKNLEWDYFLLKAENVKHVAPVKFFQNAPLAKIADDFLKKDVFIELFNPFVKCQHIINWIGKIIDIAGYKGLVEFETFENTKPRYGWIDFCSDVPKPLGYSKNNQILLFPPYDVRKKYPNFLQEVKSRFFDSSVPSPTISDDHAKIVEEAIKAKQEYKLNNVVEIIDKSNLSHNRMAKITALIGDRLHCAYNDHAQGDSGFWLNCKSQNLHRVGFSHTIGCDLVGVKQDLSRLFNPDTLPPFSESICLEKGMLLEARHPVLTSKISYCRISKVLKYGYFKAWFNVMEDKQGLEYVFHITSPYIFPCGFAKSHEIKPLLPRDCGKNRTFVLEEYCAEKNVQPIPSDYFMDREQNPFELGMKMEAVDICRPGYIGPATVTKIANHMLLIHFDGWSREKETSFQWTDWQSPDIYPLGWSKLVGHELQSYPENHKPEDTSKQQTKNSECNT